MRSFSAIFFQSTGYQTVLDLWDLAKDIRSDVFCDEFDVPQCDEFDDFDLVSRHGIGLIGDLPICSIRWRLISGDHLQYISILTKHSIVYPVCNLFYMYVIPNM